MSRPGPNRRWDDLLPWRHRYGALIAYLLVVTAAIASLAVQTIRINDARHTGEQALYHSTIASCERQNAAREAANDSARSLRSFLLAAVAANKARAKTQAPAQRRISLHTASVLQDLADHQHVIPIIDCPRAIRKP